MINSHNSYYVTFVCCIFTVLIFKFFPDMNKIIIEQMCRMCGNSFIHFMLDTRTNKRFYTVSRPDGISLDFKRIDAAERFALYE